MLPYRFRLAIMSAVIVAAFPLILWLILPAAPAGFGWDETWYLWMAEWFSGRPEYQRVSLLMMEARQYPPLFPYLLSFTGEVLVDFSNGLRMNAALLCAGSGVLMAWLNREGMPAGSAVICGLMLMFNPVALEFGWLLMSEPLFIFLTTVALALASMPGETRGRWFVVGLLAGLAIATRGAGWALALALLAQLVFQRAWRIWPAWMAGLALGLLIEFWLKAGLPEAHSYLQGFRDNLGSVNAAYLVSQASAMAKGWAGLWGSALGSVLIAAWVIPGLLMRLSRAQADAWYILATLGMLLAWPFPGQMDRFLWVLLPAVFISGLTTIRIFSALRRPVLVSGLVLTLVFGLSMPEGLGRSVHRILNPPGEGLNEMSRMSDWILADDPEEARITLRVYRRMLDDMGRISRSAAGKGCIYSEYPALVSIQTRSVAFASPWNALGQVDQVALRCNYYYLVPDALPGVTAEDISLFASRHEALFRSTAPYDPTGQRLLGVFYRLARKVPDEHESDD